MVHRYEVNSLADFINIIAEIKKSIDTRILWFRGEPESDTPLLPRIFRSLQNDGLFYSPEYENRLLQNFRLKARAFEKTPSRDNIDEWLFLAQHYGLPTRLLDWTEGALFALYFALTNNPSSNSLVWVLDPLGLNRAASNENISIETSISNDDEFPLSWFEGSFDYELHGSIIEKKYKYNIGHINIKGAWTHNRYGIDLPVAIYPPNIDKRIFSQKSCFTVHGKKPESINELFENKNIDHLLARISISTTSSNDRICLISELNTMGITESLLFPDLENLSKDIKKICIDLSRTTDQE